MSLPSFTGNQGICKQLEDDIGSMEGAFKWQTLLEGESRTGKEFREAWASLQGEAQHCADFLSDELGAPLSEEAARVGSEGSS